MKVVRFRSSLLGLVSLLASFAVQAATFNIDIQNFAFVPQDQTIKVGDTVTWMQRDASQHTVTSGQSPTPDGLWDSGLLNEGEMFSHTFQTAGTFPYFCRPHTFMTGSITVEAAQVTIAVRLISPTNNTTLSSPGSIALEASVTPDNSGALVEFLDNGAVVASATNSPYKASATLQAGTHTISARATAGGASASSETAVVTVGGGGTRIDNPFPAKLAKGNITIELQTILDGLISPVGLAAPDDQSGRLFVVDQAGLLYAVTNGVKLDTPALDVRSRLVKLNGNYDERGLLGVAFHPKFAENPLVYTYTSEPNGPMADFMIMIPNGTNNHQSVIAEWRMDPANPNQIDPASRREILRVDKPQSNHNGGVMRFGPDGYLYFTIGDGGAADDQGPGHSPGGNGQDKTKILGKVLRIDVDGRNSANGQYGVPADNPFVNEAGAVHEIYAYGLRNPYSFSFDRGTGDLWLGDVGQNQVEEIDRIVKGGNYGWSIKEGGFYFDPNGTNNGFVATAPVRVVPPDLIEPVAQYDHDEGKAVIGGYLYRGSAVSTLSGKYVTADWGDFTTPSGRLFYLDGSDLKELRIGLNDRSLGYWVKGFGEDPDGELYVFASTNLGPSGVSGKMLKIVPVLGSSPVRFTGVSASGNQLVLSWSGAPGSYLVQRKSSLTETNWANVLTTTNREARVSLAGQKGFYRVSVSSP